jgi:putative ATP-binding cassette transporter
MSALRKFWRLARPYWLESEERWGSLGILAGVLALTFATVQLYVAFNDWSRAFYDALQKLDGAAFPHLLARFCLLAGAIIFCLTYQFYLTQLVQIRWRRWMTEHTLDRWLSGRSYYLATIAGGVTGDNPDQRIADDLKYFSEESLSLLTLIFNHVLTLWSFSFILWKVSGTVHLRGVPIPGYMFWAALAYAIFGTLVSHWLGRPLIPLDVAQQKREADFRFALVRVRENAESIALSAGETAERTHLRGRFDAVYSNFLEVIRKQKQLILYQNLHRNFSQMIPLFLAAPRLFSKAIELGQFMQISNAFSQVQTSLAFFVASYSSRATRRSRTGARCASGSASSSRGWTAWTR